MFWKCSTPVLPYTLGCTSLELSVTAIKRTVPPSLAALNETISSPEPMPVQVGVVHVLPLSKVYFTPLLEQTYTLSPSKNTPARCAPLVSVVE
jgi:hypothetical protein